MLSLPVGDELLVAYADGELDEANKQRVESLMARDVAVRERVAMFKHSAEMLRLALSSPEYTSVPERITAQVLKPTPRARLARVKWLALPVAAAIAGLVVGNAVLPHYFGVETYVTAEDKLRNLLSEVAEYHGVFARESEHLVEIPATRLDHIQAWLGNRVRYPFTVPDLASRGLTFVGARMLAIAGSPVAQLMYVDNKGERLALCIVLLKGELNTSMQSAREGDFRVFGWVQGDHVFIAVGPQANPMLESLAQNLPGLLGHS